MTLKATGYLLLLASFLMAGLFLASSCHYLRKQPQTRFGWSAFVTTFAGDGSPGLKDGEGREARFANPFGVAVDASGNIYVSDAGENNRIRKIAPNGTVSTIAGGVEGFADGRGSEAAFNTPSGLAIDEKGNLYVADTSNNRIRKVTSEGMVTTIAGDGVAGSRDGPAQSAEFNGPLGVGVDKQGNVYVADTYNDRIRKVTPDGQVSTLAGGASPGYQDGPDSSSLFDTPCGVVADGAGNLFVADTGNGRIRKLTGDQVSTFAEGVTGPDGTSALAAPIGLAITHDGYLYVAENRRGRIVQLDPSGQGRVIAGGSNGFANGDGPRARFNGLAGLASDAGGALYVADTANYLVRRIVPADQIKGPTSDEGRTDIPKLDADTLRVDSMPWPVDPQSHWHEVVATMGEVRGNFEGESRNHLHSGLDIQGADGSLVRAIYDEKVSWPLNTWELGGLGEGIRVGVLTYVHIRVGRNQQNKLFDPSRLVALMDQQGKMNRIRVKRGTRFHVGDPLGTINRMYHVHLNLGPPGAEINPLILPFKEFGDHIPPTIEHDGVQLFDKENHRITEKKNGLLVVQGDVSIVVDAYDQVDHDQARRRLGLYKLGYQILNPDGSPAPGFDQPRINLEFNRLPSDPYAVKLAFADSSGITVYGSAVTRFLYNVTNTVRDGTAASGCWHTTDLPPGEYVLRIIAADYAGNEAVTGRDLPIVVQNN
jgi:sugar lactone lactonase YvrE